MSKELEQKAREIANSMQCLSEKDKRDDDYYELSNSEIFHRNIRRANHAIAYKAALEALQLKQNIIDRMENQRKFDNNMIVEKDKTIASLQKRCGRLEAMLLNCKKTLRMWEPDYPSDEEKQLQRDLWRLEQALTETKGGEA